MSTVNFVLDCARLKGHSAVVCGCKQADRWLPCPAEAMAVLTPTYAPQAYAQVAEEMRREAEKAPPPMPTLVHRIGIISAENAKARDICKHGLERADCATCEPPTAYHKPQVEPWGGSYTGSICDVCGSTRMRRSGTCETCDDCGAAGGCG